jgi:hypothetical protein
VEIAAFIVGALGLAYGAILHFTLRGWQRTLTMRIAVAYKGRVKIQAPIREWITWSRSVEKNADRKGQEVFKMGGTTVAILKPLPKEHGKTTVTTRKGT